MDAAAEGGAMTLIPTSTANSGRVALKSVAIVGLGVILMLLLVWFIFDAFANDDIENSDNRKDGFVYKVSRAVSPIAASIAQTTAEYTGAKAVEDSKNQPDPPVEEPIASSLFPSALGTPATGDPTIDAAKKSQLSFFNKTSQSVRNPLLNLPAADLPVPVAVPPTITAPNSGDPSVNNPFFPLEPQSATLLPGTIVKARLDTAINSENPSTVRARVVETIFDSVTGLHVLVPQGSVLVGTPAINSKFGQERIQIAWTTLVIPPNKIVSISGQAAADQSGQGGIQADVDNHWFEIFAAAAATSVLTIGAAASTNSEADTSTFQSSLADGVAASVLTTGQTITQRMASLPPTLSVGAGQPVTIIVNRPITLEK
jgi:type IV secretion system protein VirB10